MSNKSLKPRRKEKRSASGTETSGSKRRTLSVLTGAISLLLGLLIFWPRVSMDPADPADVNNPFSVSFTITNTGFISLHHLSARLFTGRVDTEPRAFEPLREYPSEIGGFSLPEWHDHTLTRDERFTITITPLLGLKDGARLSGADVAIVISYQPWYLPVNLEKPFRFVTQRQSDGRIYWYSKPIE